MGMSYDVVSGSGNIFGISGQISDRQLTMVLSKESLPPGDDADSNYELFYVAAMYMELVNEDEWEYWSCMDLYLHLSNNDLDSDGDGYSDVNEVEKGTDTFDEFDFPGSDDIDVFCKASSHLPEEDEPMSFLTRLKASADDYCFFKVIDSTITLQVGNKISDIENASLIFKYTNQLTGELTEEKNVGLIEWENYYGNGQDRGYGESFLIPLSYNFDVPLFRITNGGTRLVVDVEMTTIDQVWKDLITWVGDKILATHGLPIPLVSMLFDIFDRMPDVYLDKVIINEETYDIDDVKLETASDHSCIDSYLGLADGAVSGADFLTYVVACPVDIQVINNTGGIINNNANVFYSGANSDVKFVIVHNPEENYKAKIIPLENGEYTFYAESVDDGKRIDSFMTDQEYASYHSGPVEYELLLKLPESGEEQWTLPTALVLFIVVLGVVGVVGYSYRDRFDEAFRIGSVLTTGSPPVEKKCCSHCSNPVEKDWTICPYCEQEMGNSTRETRCLLCDNRIESDWVACPYCEFELKPKGGNWT